MFKSARVKHETRLKLQNSARVKQDIDSVKHFKQCNKTTQVTYFRVISSVSTIKNLAGVAAGFPFLEAGVWLDPFNCSLHLNPISGFCGLEWRRCYSTQWVQNYVHLSVVPPQTVTKWRSKSRPRRVEVPATAKGNHTNSLLPWTPSLQYGRADMFK